MKNVVVEIQGKHAVLMNTKGDFIRIRNRSYEVGQRLETGKVKQKASFAKWAVSVAAAVAILFGGGAYAYYTPYTETSFDINPSIEFSTNIFDMIIDVKAMNPDAEQILQKIQLKDCDLQTALTRLVDELISEGYLTPDEAAQLMLTTTSQDQTRAKTMLSDMIKLLNREMDKNKIKANIQGECISNELKIRAREYGVSPGKLRLAEQYAQSTKDPSKVNIKEWLDKSVKDIVAATNANQKQNNGSVLTNGTQNQDGYTGGDLNDNGYNGGDQSDNAQNAGTTDQNGYLGGDQSDNGYNGGTEINNDDNAASPGATDSPGNSNSPSERPENSSRPSDTAGNKNAPNTSGANTDNQNNNTAAPTDKGANR